MEGFVFLPKLVGPHLAKQLFFSAEPISAERLYQLGVINYLYPLNQLEEESLKLAVKLANGPTKAYGMMKSSSAIHLRLHLMKYWNRNVLRKP